MTANELADWIEKQGNGGAGNMHSQTATMLREQQKTINKLLRWEEHYLAVIESMSQDSKHALNPALRTYDGKAQEK